LLPVTTKPPYSRAGAFCMDYLTDLPEGLQILARVYSLISKS